MIEIHRKDLIPNTSYYIESQHKYKGKFLYSLPYIGGLGGIISIFDNVKNVRTQSREHDVFISANDEEGIPKFYQDSKPIIEKQLHKRILLSLGFCNDIVEKIYNYI